MYSENGVVLDEGTFEQGLPVGVHRRRYPSGVLQEEKHYHTQGFVDHLQWDEKGFLKYEGLVLEGKRFLETRWRTPQETINMLKEIVGVLAQMELVIENKI